MQCPIALTVMFKQRVSSYSGTFDESAIACIGIFAWNRSAVATSATQDGGRAAVTFLPEGKSIQDAANGVSVNPDITLVWPQLPVRSRRCNLARVANA